MKDINIAVCVDDNFAKHLAVLLFSLGVHLKQDRFLKVYVVCDGGLSEENKNKIKKTVQKFNIEVLFTYDNNDYTGINVQRFFSRAGYFKINLPMILPQNVEKVLYLDVDIVANGDIGEIFDMNVKFLKAVIDPNLYLKKYYDILFNTRSQNGYFNSGVMLLNLNKLREIRSSERIMQYVKKNNEIIWWYDQDGLNYLFHDKYEIIPPKYNFIQCLYALKNIRQEIYPEEEYFEAKKNPVLIHYAGSTYKPWLFESIGHYKYLYAYYLKETPYKNEIDSISFIKILKKIKNILIYLYLPTFLQKILININRYFFIKQRIKKMNEKYKKLNEDIL